MSTADWVGPRLMIDLGGELVGLPATVVVGPNPTPLHRKTDLASDLHRWPPPRFPSLSGEFCRFESAHLNLEKVSHSTTSSSSPSSSSSSSARHFVYRCSTRLKKLRLPVFFALIIVGTAHSFSFSYLGVDVKEYLRSVLLGK